MTGSKPVTIPLSYTWKARVPGSMPMTRFPDHWTVWAVVFMAGYKAVQGMVDFQTTSHWSQKRHHHQNFPALECGACSAAPGEGLSTSQLWPPSRLEKEFVFIFLNDFQQCLCVTARGMEKIPQINMKAHLRSTLGISGNKLLVVLILFCFGSGWHNWIVCPQTR